MKFVLKGKLPEGARVYILGNLKPLSLLPEETLEMEAKEGYYSLSVDFEEEGKLFYKYCYIYGGKIHKETELFGMEGYRELKPGLKVQDFWNLRIEESTKRPCIFLWRNPIIYWDGKVSVCCTDINAKLIVGDLNRQNLRDIWEGEKITEFRIMHIMGKFHEMPSYEKNKLPVCLTCQNSLVLEDDEVVDYLKSIGREELIEPYLKRVNPDGA